MFKSGKLVLINGTSFEWRRVYCYTYQLICFEFPAIILPGSCEICPIQWSNQSFITNWNDKGDVSYELVGTNYSFDIIARIDSGFDIYVVYSTLSNLGNNRIKLEWLDERTGYIQFFLSGRIGKFVSTGSIAGTNWMSANLDILGDLTLKELCLPGSHDSGMSEVKWQTVFATQKNCKTQNLNIYQQLECGIRYFDLRPIIENDEFYTGHYANIIGGIYQGARGQSIKTIIDQINSFCASNNELIILSISHCLNLENGLFNRIFNQAEFDDLCCQLLNINHRFICSEDGDINLLDKKLNYFIANGRSAVCIILKVPNLTIDTIRYLHKGFYRNDEFKVIDEYANTNKLDLMIKDQMNKLFRYKSEKNRKNNFFLLSWTLTQQNIQTTFGESIFSMAIIANSNLFKLLFYDASIDGKFEHFVRHAYPNVISCDFITSDLCSMSLGINLFSSLNRTLSNRRVQNLYQLIMKLIRRYLLVFISLSVNLLFYLIFCTN